MKIIYWTHAVLRMFQRKISIGDVHQVIASGTTIEDYPDDQPYPSRFILGWNRQRPIHVVLTENIADDELIVITVYKPDPAQWSLDFKSRLP